MYSLEQLNLPSHSRQMADLSIIRSMLGPELNLLRASPDDPHFNFSVSVDVEVVSDPAMHKFWYVSIPSLKCYWLIPFIDDESRDTA